MKQEAQHTEKRPRIRSAAKAEAVFSTDRVRAKELATNYNGNPFKRKDSFGR